MEKYRREEWFQLSGQGKTLTKKFKVEGKREFWPGKYSDWVIIE